jgi:hypothetical protein
MSDSKINFPTSIDLEPSTIATSDTPSNGVITIKDTDLDIPVKFTTKLAKPQQVEVATNSPLMPETVIKPEEKTTKKSTVKPGNVTYSTNIGNMQ